MPTKKELLDYIYNFTSANGVPMRVGTYFNWKRTPCNRLRVIIINWEVTTSYIAKWFMYSPITKILLEEDSGQEVCCEDILAAEEFVINYMNKGKWRFNRLYQKEN